MVERICGTPKDKFLKVAAMIAETSAKDKFMTSMYALGWTQHSKGSQNIRTMAMLQLILGNIGCRGGGMNALRGHSNIQGLTDIGLMSHLIPGYLTIPTDKEDSLDDYMSTRGFKPLRPDQTSYWQNYKKFFVSFQKSMWGDAATADNNWAYDWLPKLDVPAYDVLRAFELMFQGKMNGYFCQGFNPLLAFPNRKKLTTALSKLKWLVIMDPLRYRDRAVLGEPRRVQRRRYRSIQTEVIQLPTTCFAEDDRLADQFRPLAAMALGRRHAARRSQERRLDHGAARSAPQSALPEGRRRLPDPHRQSDLELQGSGRSDTGRAGASELNGSALADVPDPNDATKTILQKGKQLVSFAALRDDGTTACGCWIYSGCFNEAGNNMARRDNTDPADLGAFPKWTWSWPVNRRILYNRASADLDGKPWDPSRKLL